MTPEHSKSIQSTILRSTGIGGLYWDGTSLIVTPEPDPSPPRPFRRVGDPSTLIGRRLIGF